jgi:hypothetical protein
MSELLLAIQAVYDALDQIGVQPAAITKNYGTPEEETIPRTAYGDGWNACAEELLDKIYGQLEVLSKGVDKNFALFALLDLGWAEGDKYILNMNDTFHYACADAEEVSKEEAPEVARLFKAHGYKGLDYWVAEKRGYDPEIPRYKARVEEVRTQERKTKC